MSLLSCSPHSSSRPLGPPVLATEAVEMELEWSPATSFKSPASSTPALLLYQ
jgi:hypothetical protein